ncbi:MAG: DNA mismatch repair protein MutS [Elusimicrobia bacterium]|nr:DNA mismatch repair protein MutS [Elusimicrobiota bacterium]
MNSAVSTSLDPKLDTPLMRQYQALKSRYPQAILFFRLGDFYEMFGSDAKIASPILGLLLTQRQGLAMCGIPHHSATAYIGKLLKAGLKVALCEQTEDPSKAKGLVRREVIRLITPGTIVEEELLEATSPNYLAVLELDLVGWGLALADVSTGEFWATQSLSDPSRKQLLNLLARTSPAEVLLTRKAAEQIKIQEVLSPKTSLTYEETPRIPLDIPSDWNDPDAWRTRPLALRAALKAKKYILENESHLKETLRPQYREPHQNMQLDDTAIRTLELVNSSTGDRRHTLWGILDHTHTSMGSRKLRNWILQPMTDFKEIEKRQAQVQELFENASARRALEEILRKISDLQRVLTRLSTPSVSPKDLAHLRNSLNQFPGLLNWLKENRFASDLSGMGERLDRLSLELRQAHYELQSALTESPPFKLSDGNVLREKYSPELDELRRIRKDSQAWLITLESREREKTGINSLKVGYTSVFGYYLEVTKTHLAKVPPEYIRKQTLTSAERYITQELKHLEDKILGAEDKIAKLESHLFHQLRERVLRAYNPLHEFASLIAELDVVQSLAEAAARQGYVRPKVDMSFELEIKEGRHPIVEKALPPGTFVPNDLELATEKTQIMILTGPNMSGKSTFLRQNALIVLMAQMGSFVPAEKARIGVVDKVLTRIGAQDALARGESTFMVEMKETSAILSSATPRSLLILDEVGRGTSTYDGISIAWALLEHLHNSVTGPRTLFATHYFELTELAERLKGIKNFNVEAKEWTNTEGKTEVVFLHKISTGPADKSYGIHVAELAGLPGHLIKRAREILQSLERGSSPKENLPPPEAPFLPFPSDHPILDEIRLLDPTQIGPDQTISLIAKWKTKLQP